MTRPDPLRDAQVALREHVHVLTAGWHDEAARVTRTLAQHAATIESAGAILGFFPIPTNSIMCRLQRAELVSPKRQLLLFRLYLAAKLWRPGESVATIAYALRYSSPQSFGRHLREQEQTTGAVFLRVTEPEVFWTARVAPAFEPADRWTTLALLTGSGRAAAA